MAWKNSKKWRGMLQMLEERNPLMENTVIYPRYYARDEEKSDVH